MASVNNLNNNGLVDVTSTSTDLSKLNKFTSGSSVMKKELSTGDLTNNYELKVREVSGQNGIAKSTMQRSTTMQRTMLRTT